MKTALACVLALCIVLPAHAQTIAPRESVGRIADVIQQQYFDEAKAAKIAADLRAEAGRGTYDKLTDPRDFASVMTDRLRPLDGHFAVSWTPPAAAAARTAGAPRRAPQPARDNYGFRAVEVLPGNIGHVDLRRFAHFEPEGDQSAREAADAAMALVARTDAVVFDLRDNGGGSPAMVGYLVGHFVPEGADIYNTFKSRGAPDASERPTVPIRGKRRLDAPVYVLTSGRTASAAEAFAYTLQAAGRATIVGEASAGGANPGDSNPVGDGLAVFVSNGAPINPITRKNWEGTGVIPEVKVPASQALERAQQLALTQLVARPLGEPAATENRWALEALTARGKAPPADLARYAGAYGAYQVAYEGERLVLRRDRRPPNVLLPLAEPGLFTVEGAPFRRIKFEDGAMVMLSPDGGAARQARNSVAATVN